MDSSDSRLDDFEESALRRTVLILDSSLFPALFPFSSRASTGTPSARGAISNKLGVAMAAGKQVFCVTYYRPGPEGTFIACSGTGTANRTEAKNGGNEAGLETTPSPRRSRDDRVLSRVAH